MSTNSQVRALIIPTGDAPAYTQDVTGDLATIQGLVGGDIEAVSLGDAATMYIHEEGKYEGLPVNGHATRMLAVSTTPLGLPGDFIAGPAVVFGVLNRDGVNDGNEHDVPEVVLALAARAGVPLATHPHA